MNYGQDTFLVKATVTAINTKIYTEVFHLCVVDESEYIKKKSFKKMV